VCTRRLQGGLLGVFRFLKYSHAKVGAGVSLMLELNGAMAIFSSWRKRPGVGMVEYGGGRIAIVSPSALQCSRIK
jgi:hypothetical protein